MSYWAAGATVGSAVIKGIGANNAAKRQQEAERQAALLRQQAASEAKQLQQPFYQGGTDAFSQLQGRLPELTQAYDPNKLTSEPGYRFGMDQGQQALERSLAARGRSVSGPALKAAAEYGTNYGTTKLNDAFNRNQTANRDVFSMLTGVSGMGQRAGESMGQIGLDAAGVVGQRGVNAADVGATNDIAQGNIWSNLLNQGASQYKDYLSKKTPGQTGYNELGDPQRLAEGGAVTGVPDRDTVLQALDAAWGQSQQPRGYQEGGPIRSKTGGKADDVNVKASGGEHMIDAEVVSMMGDGNNEAGHALLEEMKRRIRAFKRSAPPDRPALAMGN